MESSWQLKDIIDLEYYLGQNASLQTMAQPSEPVSFDRQVYLDYTKSHQSPLSRRYLLKYWIDRQREKDSDAAAGWIRSPGNMFSESFRIVRIVLVIFALVLGASVAWTILSYRGIEPVNVFTFLWAIIVLQILLLLILMSSLVLRRLGLLKAVKGWYPLLSSAISRIALALKASGEKSLSASNRDRVLAILGLLGQHKTLYGSLFFWPIFSLLQTFGVCFNVGILCATLIKVTITDLAFGWQSTLQLPAEAVFRIVKILSLPWSWIVPVRYAHPSISQIEGSKMVLKEGMAHLATTDLVSWWPFLCFAVLCYGFLPRAVLLITGLWRQYQILNRIDFAHAACERLLQRMQTPQMATLSRPFASKPAPVTSISKSEYPNGELITRSIESLPATIVFVPKDIDETFSDDDVRDRISNVLRLRMLGKLQITMDFQKDRQALKNLLEQTDVSLTSARLIILQEAWQPPIRENISWISNLRSIVGKKTGIIIALIGKPAHGKIFTSPRNADLVIWEHAIDGLGDPYIRTENFGG